MRRLRWIASVGAALLVLTGCTQTVSDPAPRRAPSPAELAEQKRAALIDDCPQSDPDVAPVANGLPDAQLACLGGGRSVRLAGLRGKPMMINVWAQWCAPCREEAPYITDVAVRPPKGLLILGIDYEDPQPDDALLFAKLSHWTYPQLQDPDKQLAGPLQLTGPPQTFFVRPDGAIAYRHTGPFQSTDEIRSLMKTSLGVDS